MDPVTLALAKSWAEGEFGDLRQLIPHVEALLDSRIVDHNLDVTNPPNGWYVRYNNGVQECWGVATIDGTDWTHTNVWGGFYKQSPLIVFPVAFLSGSKPHVLIAGSDPRILGRGSWFTHTGVTAMSFTAWAMAHTTETTALDVSWLARGRWK